MSIELYPSIAKIKRNGVYENLPGFVPETHDIAVEQMIAGSESSAVAQYVHNAGAYFILNNTLYKAIVKINIGDAIVVGTNCEVAVIGNDLTNIYNSIDAINSEDPLFDSLIHLPDDDSFFDKTTFSVTNAGRYTKLSHNQFQLYGGSGTTYWNYPIHGTRTIVSGTNEQLRTRVRVSDFLPIPQRGIWYSTGAALSIQTFLTTTETSHANYSPQVILLCANITDGEFEDTPVIMSTSSIDSGYNYANSMIRLRDFGFEPLRQYTHYAIFVASKRRTSTLKQTCSFRTARNNTFNTYFASSTYNNVESTTTASKNYNINDLILYNSQLYKVTTPITSGSTIVTSGSGANVAQTTALAEISNIYNALNAVLTCFQHTAWEDANGSTYIGALENLIT